MASKPLTPFQEKICTAAARHLTHSPFIGLGFKSEGPVGMSHSESNKVFIVHFKGMSKLGLLSLHVWFEDVDEKKGTFKMHDQVTFAGKFGGLNAGEEDYAAQLFWGGSLGFRYVI